MTANTNRKRTMNNFAEAKVDTLTLIRGYILAVYWNGPEDRAFDETDADDMCVTQFDPDYDSPRGAVAAGAERGDLVITDPEHLAAEVVRIVNSDVVSIYAKP